MPTMKCPGDHLAPAKLTPFLLKPKHKTSSLDDSIRMLKVAADTKDLKLGKIIHAQLIISNPTSTDADMSRTNSLVFLYVKCDQVSIARQLVDRMRKRNLVSWSALMAAYLHNGHALKFLDSSRVCGRVEEGKHCHGFVLKFGMVFHPYVKNALVHLYYRCLEIDGAITRLYLGQLAKATIAQSQGQDRFCRDYTNPYLPVNPTAIEGIVQPTLGPDGKKKEPESNVPLASIENMQYAVTVDVLHAVFSAFGTVQKIAIFEKNGQTQALLQYTDVTTAAVAREALEGIAYMMAYGDKSRDYTIPDASLLAEQQASSLPPAPPVWQNPQAAQMYPGNDFGAKVAAHAQIPPGQVASWDPNTQAGRLTFVPAASSYPSQNFAAASVPAYAIAATPGGSLPLSQRSPITSGVPSSVITQPGVQTNLRPGGASPPGVQPGGVSSPGQPYYGQ
ncbi:hypothetical protein FEM48_Zijuj04G0045300 [Ziziphus jujuba var. spinosa]|uniref:RRM domain-containing protein n=1 Tax=Ziziphus jujuba var. spinosa TaxID=714518 RepID=A0A978VHT9_ZIZJJ|nr:hypothetical protein FEM48_Zijuj04G0045300 [Ziziphus jujuba var. spinosa]